MKKIILISFSILMLFAFVGCTNSSNPSSDNNSGMVETKYADGTYRGGYIDSKQIEIEFALKDNKFESIKFRSLSYNNVDYLNSKDSPMKDIAGQYQQLAEYLVGKDVKSLKDLYNPEKIAKNTDAVTSATLRSSKMISAINDGLGRGVYSMPK